MLTVRWTTLGPPITPRVSHVRGVGNVRVTAEDIERYGETYLDEDRELLLERVMDDPEARFRIAGPAPPTPRVAEPAPSRETGQRQKARGTMRKARRGWLARLFGR